MFFFLIIFYEILVVIVVQFLLYYVLLHKLAHQSPQKPGMRVIILTLQMKLISFSNMP